MLLDKVILVNARDEWLGIAGKEAAHRQGMLHRAVSVFITNSSGDILLQQRAAGKYHSGGLWSNACCTHPSPGESTASAATRRLRQELGVIAGLKKSGTFRYRVKVSEDMYEHELDHFYSGTYDGGITPDAAEVQAWKWISMHHLEALLAKEPQQFTAWFAPLYAVWRQALKDPEKPALNQSDHTA